MLKTLDSATAQSVPVTVKQPRAVRWALASLAASMLLSSLGTSIANVGLPTLAREFQASFPEVQWVVLAYLLAVTTLIVSVGRLGDLVGRRRLLLAGLVTFTGASVSCGIAPTLGSLIPARALQGIGAAVMMALTMALVGEVVPKAGTGRAMGLLGTMSAIGTALGPSLGGFLLDALGWRALFLILVPLGIAAFLVARGHLPLDRPSSPKGPAGFDLNGTLVLMLTLGAYALAMTLGRGHFGLRNQAMLLAAACGAVLFVVVEKRTTSPLIQLSMFRDRTMVASLSSSAIVSTVMMATLVVGPFYLARALLLAPALVGLVLSAGPLAAALASMPAGRIADRIGTRRATLAGLFAMGMGSAFLALLPVSTGVVGYILPIVVMTTGYALFQTANNTAVMAGVHADRRGVVSGMLNLSRNLGLITGAAALGAVFAFASSASDLTMAAPGNIAAGMRGTFAVAAVLTVLAMALSGGRGAIAREVGAAGVLR